MVDRSVAVHLRQQRYNWWCHRASAGGLSTDIMIPNSLDIWVFPRLFAGYLVECIGPDFARTFNPIWPAVQYVWGESLCVLAVRLWDMFLLVTDGTRWLWIFWTCRLTRKRVTGMF